MLSCVCATPSLTETFNIDGNQFKIANRRSPKEMKDRRGQGTGDRGQGTGDRGQGTGQVYLPFYDKVPG